MDECTGPKVVEWVGGQGREIFSVYDEARGIDDEEIIRRADAEDWILITNGKDFGEKVYRERRSHRGVIFMRLADERVANKTEVLRRLIEVYADELPDRFVVVTETRVRFART